MNPKQLNGNAEFGSCPRQQHRFYSVFFGAACLQTGNTDRSVTKILKLYEKDTDHARLQTPPHSNPCKIKLPHHGDGAQDELLWSPACDDTA